MNVGKSNPFSLNILASAGINVPILVKISSLSTYKSYALDSAGLIPATLAAIDLLYSSKSQPITPLR